MHGQAKGSDENRIRGWGQAYISKAMRCGMVVTLLLGCACGCGHKQPSTIMVITPTGGLEYWENFNHAVRAAAESGGIHVQLAAPQSETDYTEQAQMVENAIARHVQGIIVSPAHQLVLASALQQAEQAHIPVIMVGVPVVLSTADFAAFVDWDEGEAGRLAARRMVALLGGNGKVGIIGVSPTMERSSIIEKAFAEEIARTPEVKLVSVKYGLSDWARGRQAVVDLMAEYPDLKGIFTTDEFSTHAAAYAFSQGIHKPPVLIGISEELNELGELRAGHIDALVISDPMELGRRAMQAMQIALDGGNAGAHSSQLPVYIVDKQTVAENPIVKQLMQRAN
jgi:ribose transport system substrate-binding protein